MKRIVLFICLLVGLTSQAQVYRYLSTEGETAWARGGLRIGGIIYFPTGSTLPTPPLSLQNNPGLIVQGEKVYRWSPTLKDWVDITGFSGVWGSIGGTLSNQPDLVAALAAKQNTLPIGSAAQYYRGDQTLGTLATDVKAIGDLLYPSLDTSAAHRQALNLLHWNTYQSYFVTGVGTKVLYGVTFGGVTKKLADWVDAIADSTTLASSVTSFNTRTGDVIPQSADYSAYYATIGHTHTFADINSKPTTLAGYGITDAVSTARFLDSLAATNGRLHYHSNLALLQNITPEDTARWGQNGTGGATADGSETKVIAGANVTVTGTGTTADPYIINALDTGGTSTPITFDTVTTRIFSAEFLGANGTALSAYTPETGSFEAVNGTPTLTGGGIVSIPAGSNFGVHTNAVGDKSVLSSFTITNGEKARFLFNFVGGGGVYFQTDVDVSGSTAVVYLVSIDDGLLDTDTISIPVPVVCNITIENGIFTALLNDVLSTSLSYNLADKQIGSIYVTSEGGTVDLNYLHVDETTITQTGGTGSGGYITGLIHTFNPGTGALYTTITRSGAPNIVSNTVMLPIGGSAFTQARQEFTGATTQALTLSNTPAASQHKRVYKNGVLLVAADYSISGTTVTLNISRAASDYFIVEYSY